MFPTAESGRVVSPDVAIITVQYNNPADTESLVASLGRLNDVANCEVVVVDNSTAQHAGADANALQYLAPCPLQLLRTPRNLYYWGGAAFALESLYWSRMLFPRWVVVCNNDLTIDDPLFLQKLRSLDSAKYPIIGPSILSTTTGKDQNPMLDSSPGVLKRLKWRLFDVDYRVARAMLALHGAAGRVRAGRPRGRSKPGEPHAPRRIHAAHGACMIFSSAFFERGGELDISVPMFAEELTIAASARNLGLPIWYYPDLQVHHREHSTTGHELTRTKYEMERMARRLYYEYPSAASRSAPGFAEPARRSVSVAAGGKAPERMP